MPYSRFGSLRRGSTRPAVSPMHPLGGRPDGFGSCWFAACIRFAAPFALPIVVLWLSCPLPESSGFSRRALAGHRGGAAIKGFRLAGPLSLCRTVRAGGVYTGFRLAALVRASLSARAKSLPCLPPPYSIVKDQLTGYEFNKQRRVVKIYINIFS